MRLFKQRLGVCRSPHSDNGVSNPVGGAGGRGRVGEEGRLVLGQVKRAKGAGRVCNARCAHDGEEADAVPPRAVSM